MNPSRAVNGDPAVSLGPETLARVGSAAVLVVLAIGAAWAGGWLAVIVAAAVAAIVHLEWIRLTWDGMWPSALGTAALVAALLFVGAGLPLAGFAVAAVAVIGIAATARGVWRPLGVLYAALLGFGLLLLRLGPEVGLEAIVVLFAVVWATDTGAFVAGRLIGGPKLAPRISPGKTWAGACGGLALGTAAGVVAAAALGLAIGWPLLATIAVLSAAAQAGDLLESVVKRRFGAKDSGRLIPGHGGLMDRVDGLTFAAAVAVIIGALNGGPAHIPAGLLKW